MIALASLRLMPGISESRCARAGIHSRDASSVMPHAAGMASTAASISSSTSAASLSSRVMWSRWRRISMGMVVAKEHAIQRLLD